MGCSRQQSGPKGQALRLHSDKVEISSCDELADMSDAELRAQILEQDKALQRLGIEMTDLTALRGGAAWRSQSRRAHPLSGAANPAGSTLFIGSRQWRSVGE